MKLIALILILSSCRPDSKPTAYTATIKPLSGPDKTVQTKMNTPVNISYSGLEADNAINPKLRIVKNPQNGKLFSCQSKGLELNCVYEPNINYVGNDRIELSVVDGDFKAEKNSVINIVVTHTQNGEITIPGDDLPEGLDDEINEANNKCAEARANGSMKTKRTTISFSSAIECDFNENGNSNTDLNAAGNGPRLNGRVRARREQYHDFSLDEDGHICDIDFNFPTQTMQYDDEIFLLLNDFVLMSSTNYSDQSGESRYANGLKTNSLGFQTYRWLGENSLYNLYYGQNVTPRYCLGISPGSANYDEICNIPRTETRGQIKLDIPPSQIINLGLASQANVGDPAKPLFKFGFVSTGDNDNGDCEHSAYSFEAIIQYVSKP